MYELFSLWQDNCSNCKKMAARVASMQNMLQANERTVKNLKDMIVMNDRQSANEILQQRSTLDW